MSTDVYGYRTLKREGKKLTVKVFNVYKDWQGFFPSPNNPTFFYSIITEMNEELQAEIKGRGDKWYDEDVMRELAPEYIRHVEVMDIENPFEEMEDTFYYEKDGKWKDEKKLPQVTYEIEVADEKLLGTIAAGISEGTTCYQAEMKLLHNRNSTIPPIDRLDPVQLATLPWVGNLQSFVHAMDNLLSNDLDIVAFFNARPADRDKLLDRLRMIIHDPLAAGYGWDLEIIGLLGWFRMKDGIDDALLMIMKHYGTRQEVGDIAHYLQRLSISAPVHPVYVTAALKILATKITGLESEGQMKLWLDLTLYRSTGEMKYKTSFTEKVKELLASTDDDSPVSIFNLCPDVFRNMPSAELEEWKDLIKMIADQKDEYSGQLAKDMIAFKKLEV